MTPLARQLRRIAQGSQPWGSQRELVGRSLVWQYGSGPTLKTTPAGGEDAVSALPQSRASLDQHPLARVEAVLFLASDALSLRRVAQLAGLADATEARTLLTQLQQRYDQQVRAFQVENIAGGYRLLTRPQFAPWVGKLGDLSGLGPSQLKLTPPALDTLTVVAYRQPVLRVEVEAIRGVGCGELLRQLIERDLLRIVGRSEELGKPLLYGTTKRFLQAFGLRSLGDLPPVAGLTTSSNASNSSSTSSTSNASSQPIVGQPATAQPAA